MSIRKRVVKGVFWSALERFSTQIIQFAISIILARLLLPENFGLIALVFIVLNILQSINEVGFGAALIHKQNRDELDYSSVFILNIILGCFLYLLLYYTAPSIALFFKDQEFTSIARLLGLTLIINSLSVVPRTILIINVDFKTQTKASFIAILISGMIGITMAYKGYGVTSLVYHSLINSVINTSLIIYFSNWKPTLTFSFTRFNKLFKFAYKLVLARLINTLYEQLYASVIGKFYTSTQLAFYNRAQSFVSLTANNVTNVIQRVSTPLLCENQNDYKLMGDGLKKFIISTSLIVYPILSLIFILAKPLVLVLLTEKWLPTVFILKVLCPTGLIFVISSFNKNIFNATGRTDLALKTEFIKKLIFSAIVIFSFQLGFKILIISQLIISSIELVIDLYYTKKQIGLPILEQLQGPFKILIVSLIMMICVMFATLAIENNYIKILAGSFLGLLIYGILIFAFNIADSNKIFKSAFGSTL